MNLYIMRHGTTVWNEKGISQGRSQNRLSKEGKLLAQKQAEKFKNVKFDIIISSPLMRTMQTANIMNAFHGVKIVKDERLTEIDQGIFTGRHKDSLTSEEWILKNKHDKSCGMETLEEVYERVLDFYNFLKTTKYEDVLVITHNRDASMLSHLATNKKKADCMKPLYFQNAEIKKFKI